MPTEISRIQRHLGVATVYVTHDQVEAMTMGDRVAVMRDGVVLQCDEPQSVYERPVNMFVGAWRCPRRSDWRGRRGRGTPGVRWWWGCGPSTSRWPRAPGEAEEEELASSGQGVARVPPRTRVRPGDQAQ